MIPVITNPSTNAILCQGFTSFFYEQIKEFLVAEEKRAIENMISGGADRYLINLGMLQSIRNISSDLETWKSACYEALIEK